MNFTANCNTEEPSKFNKDTLTTLRLVKKYNPGFVTTFIVSQKEAHCLTGDVLRRCENMITLKKKKEINAKYSGLLKSKVKSGSYDVKSKRKLSARTPVRGEKPKTPRRESAKSQAKNDKYVKSIDLQCGSDLAVDCKNKSDVKEIFKSNVYSNYSNSTVDDSAKYSTDLLPTPKDIIERTGSKIKSFWNLQNSIKTENPLRQCRTNWIEKNSPESRVNNKQLDISRNDIGLQPESNAEYVGVAASLKSKKENLVGRKTPVKIFKRSCFSLINISSNECKVLYKNCLLCNRRKNVQVVIPNEIHVLEPWRGTRPENLVKRRRTLDQLSRIGFASVEYTIHKIENATAEYRADERFTIHFSYNNWPKRCFCRAFGKFMKSLIISEKKEAVENPGDTKFASYSRYKIGSVTFGLILTLYFIHLLYAQILSSFVIK